MHVFNAPWLAERFPELKIEDQKAVQERFIRGYEVSSNTPERADFLIARYKVQIAEGKHVYVDRGKADNVYVKSDEPVLDLHDLEEFDLDEDFTTHPALDWGETRDLPLARIGGLKSRWYGLTIVAGEFLEHVITGR